MPKIFSRLCLLALVGLLPVVVWAQPEILTRDGFPTDYQSQDFAPTGLPVTPTLPPGTGVRPHLDPLEANEQAEAALQQQKTAAKQSLQRRPATSTSPSNGQATGQVIGKSFAIDELPHTPGTTGPGRLKTTTGSATAAVAGDVIAPSLTLPQPEVPAANDLPTDAAALAGWGPLTPAAAGLTEIPGDTIWAGVEATAVQNILSQIVRTPPPSAALKTVLVRLLLVQGAPPKGAGLDWLVTRANALTAIGRDEAALQLWRAVPTGVLTAQGTVDTPHQQLAQGWLAAQLVSGETQAACAVAKQRMALAGLPPAAKSQGQQAVAVCQELAGDLKGAALSWQLAGSPDPFLLHVKDAWERRQPLHNDPALASLKSLDPLAAALLAARPALLLATPQLVTKLPQVALRRLMNTPGLPVTLRLTAAETLAAGENGGNALLADDPAADNSPNLIASPDAAAVAALYAALPFAPAVAQDPLGSAAFLAARNQGTDRANGRALLWQTATRNETATPLSLRALAWQRWHDQILQHGLGGLLSGLTVRHAALTPGPQLDGSVAWLAPMALAGDWRNGQPAPAAWLDVMTSSTVLAPHLPFLRLANGVLAGDPPDTAAWAAGLQSNTPTLAPANPADTARLLAVAQALGLAPPADAVQSAWLSGNPAQGTVTAAPSPLWQDAVTAAVQQHQAGLAILLLTQPQAGEDPAATGWLQVRLRTLRALGLGTLAKRLAGEALAIPLATLTEAVEPAPPALNNGHAPASGGHQIGGGLGGALPVAATAPQTDDGLILPPPRIAPVPKPTVKKLGKLPLTPSNQSP